VKIIQKALTPLEPLAITIFAEKVDLAKLPFLQK
jgi:hypothetical protein